MVGWVECNEPRQLDFSLFPLGLVALDPPYAVFRNRNYFFIQRHHVLEYTPCSMRLLTSTRR